MIRGTKRALVSAPDTAAPNKNKIDLALMAKIHNRWDVEVVDAATGEVKQRAQGLNVICNGWWSNVPIGNSPGGIQYGRGSGTPAASDTALFSRIGGSSVSTVYDESTLSQGFVSWQISCQLAPATAVGETITEVGLSNSSVDTLLYTHAMLQDMNGNPISIVKTATDIVNIYATVFLHIETDRYANGKIRVTNNVDWMRGQYMASSTSQGVLLMRSAYYGEGTRKAFASWPYSSATKTRTFTFDQYAVADGNYSGGALCMVPGSINTTYSSSRKGWLIMFPAAKSQILNEAVGTGNGSTKNFATKFAFPSNATVYVDGVAQNSGVTVFSDHPGLSTRLDCFLLPVFAVTDPDKLVLLYDITNSDGTKNGQTIAAGGTRIFERCIDGLAITSLKLQNSSASNTVTIYVSDDLETWTDVGSTMTSSTWWSIPAQYAASKYLKIKNNGSNAVSLNGGTNADLTGYAIRFDTAPAAGAAITASYQTPMIPKDSDHIMDVSMTVTFGEYTGEES